MSRVHFVVAAGLAVIAFCAGAASIPDETVSISDGDRAALAAATDQWAARHAFNGVVMASRGGDIVHAWSAGWADAERSRALDPDSRFQTGSVDKYFAALAAFALAEDGRLDLDAPISTYLPGYRADTGARLSLRALLTNRSGLPNDILQAFRADRAEVDALSPADAVARYGEGDLQFEPGERFDYVLTNWLIVQHLLETVAGEPYPDVIARHVFGPAGMEQSGSYIHDLAETDPQTDNVAIGFDPADANGRGDYRSPRFFRGSFTTGRDLLRLEDALAAGHVLGPEALAEFRSVRSPQHNYAHGGRFDVWEICGAPHRVSTQSGSNGATNITAAYLIETGEGVAMLTNTDQSQGRMFELSADLLAILLGCGVED